MPIDVPSAGSPILDTWGAAVAAQLNRMVPLYTTADQSTDSATAVNVTDISWPVVSGRLYLARLHGYYSVSATNQGLQLSINGPGATAERFYGKITGNASAVGSTEVNGTSSGLQGRTSTDAAAPSLRAFWVDIWYQANATGTARLQFARGGTSGSTGVTLKAGLAGHVIEAS